MRTLECTVSVVKKAGNTVRRVDYVMCTIIVWIWTFLYTAVNFLCFTFVELSEWHSSELSTIALRAWWEIGVRVVGSLRLLGHLKVVCFEKRIKIISNRGKQGGMKSCLNRMQLIPNTIGNRKRECA